ncbi:MAG: WYL domain-containing transcriptional regulator [Desulfobacteraceae bacterium]|jgi:predicted DNA-binding transcriptional regulator YafY|nr:MAG: WYL domain-containing transcriptional regulator [Desulfobacteraceae bacterium]
MSGSIAYERFIWFHEQIKAGRYPNAPHLADHFEVSLRTAKRHIEFMRDRLGAPLVYKGARRGYGYDDASFELPLMPVTPEEVLSVLIARTLLSKTAGGVISEAMRRFGLKLLDQAARFGWEPERLDEIFSAAGHGFSPVPAAVFQAATRSLLDRKPLAFTYTSPQDEIPVNRVVEPHHLQYYMGSWVLIARCRLRDDFRMFYLSRMSNWKMLPDTFIPLPKDAWQSHVKGSFGIFQGREKTPVTLRFTPFRARWIRKQTWHPDQTLRDAADGGVELSFPVADFREVKMMILQFGADVEVVSPAALRTEIADEIRKMTRIYPTGDTAVEIMPEG